MAQLDRIASNPLFLASQAGESLRKMPLGFIDIGARGGVHPMVDELAALTAVMGFEPDEDECRRMQAELARNSPYADFCILPMALADKEGQGTIYMYDKPTNNSLRRGNVQLLDRYRFKTFGAPKTASLKTTTLDKALFGDGTFPHRYGELMKLDTQGTEYEILSHARRTLKERTVALVVETCFVPLYDGQMLFAELETFLRQEGFSFYGFLTMHHRSLRSLDKYIHAGRERAIWADALFFKDPILTGFVEPALDERGKYALFACSLLLGYYDFAIELAMRTWADGREADRIKTLVKQLAELPMEKTIEEVKELSRRVTDNPSRANVEVGRFVDKRRHLCDYDDVFVVPS